MEHQVPDDQRSGCSDPSVESVSQGSSGSLVRFFKQNNSKMAGSICDKGFMQCSSETYRKGITRLARKLASSIRKHDEGSARWLGDIYPSVRIEEVNSLVSQATEWPRSKGGIAIIWHPEGTQQRYVRRRESAGDKLIRKRQRRSDSPRNFERGIGQRSGTPQTTSASSEEESDSEASVSSTDSKATLEETTIGHVHIYHSCPYRHHECRCRFLRGIRLKRRTGRRTVFVRHLTTEHFCQWLFYFLRSPRRFLFLALGKISLIPEIDKIRDLQRSEEMEENSSDEEMAASLFPFDYARRQPYGTQSKDKQTFERIAAGTPESQRSIPGCNFKPSRPLQQRIENHANLVQAIKEFLCVPAYSTCELSQWMSNPLLSYFDKADPDYKRAVSTVTRTYQRLSIHDIWNLVQSAGQRTWYARRHDHYMDEEMSFNAIQMLLLHQYRTRDGVRAFLQRLYNIGERIEPKRNSMFVSGPANCGKTWFFDMVCAYYLNVGHVANFVRGEHFPLNDCVGRRVLMWNEPSIMPSAYDTVKMVAGGDPCPANVKYQGHSIIDRTPLFLTGNRFNFPNQEVWTTRMYHERWQPCPKLRKYVNYPNPMTYYHIMQEYSVIE